ncbi:chymotrypsin inhibitor Ani s 6-like [Anopheles stephensi]|uniref:TIL domain-containing protein n=1 Tax=Anopheles stephensi TaxID=30069 RepID=A0A182YPX1_ANOST|nr:chymotrypsin inhibitor Ani s 6-like [Anopheles stephensi]
MMLRSISVIVLLTALMLTFGHGEECTEANEEYYNCASPCRRNCTNLGAPLENCTIMCVSGCFCKPGYFRREDNACVKPWFCAKSSRKGKFPAGTNLEIPPIANS